MNLSRNEILEKLKTSNFKQPEKTELIGEVFPKVSEPLDLVFKETLEKVNGNVVICDSTDDLEKQLQSYFKQKNNALKYCFDSPIQTILNKANISFNRDYKFPEEIEFGITGCEFLIAQTGSVMISSALSGGRKSFIYPPVHVVIAKKEQVLATLEAAYSSIQKKYEGNLPSQITIITGPSRTADIEKTLILGAHGPKKLDVFIY
jgi:L-lactate dehydrogenase complex protein LldG